ncbi:MAG: AsmA-like C-terminal region-containing protein [Chthoniobacterales bacterium]
MQKLSKVILFILAGIAGLFLAVLIGVNLWLQSTGIQSRLQEKVEETMGISIHVGSTYYTPWGGVQLSGLAIPDQSTKQSFLEAQGFGVHFDLIPLFQRRFVISRISLNKPVLIWHQSKDGKWRLPSFAAKSAVSSPSEHSTSTPPRPISPEGQPTTVQNTATPPDTAIAEPPVNLSKFLVEVRQVRIEHGDGTFIDSSGKNLAAFKDLSIETEIRPNGDLVGSIQIGDINFGDKVHLRHLYARFTKQNNILASNDIEAHLAHGLINGQLSVNLGRESSFKTDLKLKNVQLPVLLTEAGLGSEKTFGILGGSIVLSGNVQDPKEVVGTGRLDIEKAKFVPMGFLQQLGTLLNIKELQMLVLEQSYATFHIHNQRLEVDDMTLKSQNLILHTKGVARFNSKINLSAELAFNPEIQKELHGFIVDSLHPSENYPGYKELPFTIWGKWDHPQTDLKDKIVNKISNVFTGLFQNITITPKAAPQPSPSPSPAMP